MVVSPPAGGSTGASLTVTCAHPPARATAARTRQASAARGSAINRWRMADLRSGSGAGGLAGSPHVHRPPPPSSMRFSRLATAKLEPYPVRFGTPAVEFEVRQ